MRLNTFHIIFLKKERHESDNFVLKFLEVCFFFKKRKTVNSEKKKVFVNRKWVKKLVSYYQKKSSSHSHLIALESLKPILLHTE